jgi:hypothetical protein
MLERKLDVTNTLYWVDKETGATYGRVIGGLGWPGSRDGFLVVAGVARVEDTDLEAFPITVLGETSAPDVDQLLREVLKAGNDFSPDRIYADTENLGMMEVLNEFNRDRRRRGLNPLRLSPSPMVDMVEGSGQLSFYLQLIKKLTRPNRKVLFFGPGSNLPGYLLGLSREDAGKAAILDHPPVAALGVVLAVLTTWRRHREPSRYQTEFDVFKPNYGAKRWEIDGETMETWNPFD